MNTQNTLRLAIGLALIVAVGSLIIMFTKKQHHGPAIGIIQIASHPALDAVRKGFEEQVRARYGDTMRFKIQNAEGSAQQAFAIAHQFAQDESIKLLFCIATRSAQAALAAQAPQPIVFSAVTDVSTLSVEDAKAGITGNCDMIDIDAYIKTIHNTCPGIKKIGVVYNSADLSASVMVDTCARLFKSCGIQVVRLTVTSEVEMPLVAALAFQDTDAVFCPIDNTVAVTIDVLAAQAIEHKRPLFVCDALLLRDGVLCAGGVNYNSLGKAGGDSAIAILHDGLSSSDIPIALQAPSEIVFHSVAAQRLHIAIPDGASVQ